jgi:hypothetical protein
MHGRRGEDRLSTHLALPRQWQNVNDYLQGHDPDLRLRASVERAGLFILERRCRRRPAVNTAMPDVSDMHVQARDGFIHISTVHPEWLNKPWNILRALRDEGVDLWAYKSSEAFCDEEEYEEHWAKETRRRRRHEDGLAYYREMFDVLSRLGNNVGGQSDRTDVSRWNNPGPVTPAPAEGASCPTVN